MQSQCKEQLTYELGPVLDSGTESNIFQVKGQPNILIKQIREELANRRTEVSGSPYVRHLALQLYIGMNVSHLNLVRINECFFSSMTNILSMVMNLVDGYSLWDIVKAIDSCYYRERISDLIEPFFANVIAQVLSALRYMHNQGIVHRDINPGNVMIGQLGIVKVIDYGFSGPERYSPVYICGTVGYMSPECCQSSNEQERPALLFTDDIWSLGVMAMYLVTGRTAEQIHFNWPANANGNRPSLNIRDIEAVPRYNEYVLSALEKTRDSTLYSPEFIDFLRHSLDTNPLNRSTASDLLSHPFIRKYEIKPASIGVAEYARKLNIDLS